MRKVILGVAVSLDGFIEGPGGEYDWCFTDQDYGMKSFLERIDAIFYGRKSYDVMTREGEKGGGNPFGKMQTYVFSNSISSIPGAIVVNGEIEARVSEIKRSDGKDIWLFGGANLASGLINLGLVDELWLAVHPILLGSGKPLFAGIEKRRHTRLTDSKTYSTGLVSLSYQIINHDTE